MHARPAFLSSIFLYTVQDMIKENILAQLSGLPSIHHWARMHKPKNKTKKKHAQTFQQFFFRSQMTQERETLCYAEEQGQYCSDQTHHQWLVLKSGINKPTTLSLLPFKFYCLLCSPCQQQSVKRSVWESLRPLRWNKSLFNKHLLST